MPVSPVCGTINELILSGEAKAKVDDTITSPPLYVPELSASYTSRKLFMSALMMTPEIVNFTAVIS